MAMRELTEYSFSKNIAKHKLCASGRNQESVITIHGSYNCLVDILCPSSFLEWFIVREHLKHVLRLAVLCAEIDSIVS
jgi:hypothetical protein